MKKRILKRIMGLALVFLMSINCFAAVVSDNDGSAFITKAEFDSLKNNFQNQIDQYNSSIDSKIDGAIASYLAGIKISNEKSQNLIIWGDKTIGLVEDYRSHVYSEGQVGGRLTIVLMAISGTDMYNMNTSFSSSTYRTASYFSAHCFHKLTASSSSFKYLVASYGKIGTAVAWILDGYASVEESLEALKYYRPNGDLTSTGIYTIGYCNGWTENFGTAGTKINKSSLDWLSICETSMDADWSKRRNKDYLWSLARNYNVGSTHNRYLFQGNELNFTSQYTFYNDQKYITNLEANTTYTDLWPKEWYGLCKSNGHDTHSTSARDLYGSGWRLNEVAGEDNFHFKIQTLAQATNNNYLYAPGNIAFLRKAKTSETTSSEHSNGWIYATVSGSKNHYLYNQNGLYKVWKATTGTSANSSNLYSEDLAKAIKGKFDDKIKTATVSGEQRDVAPLYIGLPIGEVKAGDRVTVPLTFVNKTTYDVGFYIDCFPEGTLASTTTANAGCHVNGTDSHIASFDVTENNKLEEIKLDITKSGTLFMKFNGNYSSLAATIKLPTQFTVISED